MPSSNKTKAKDKLVPSNKENDDSVGDATKRKDWSFVKKDLPVRELTGGIAVKVKSTTDNKVFPYTKFVKNATEMEKTGYILLVFSDLTWDREDKGTHRLARARYYQAILNYMVARLRVLRDTVVSSMKKACIGK